MQIKTIKVGDLRTNCYIAIEGTRGIVIDPGFDIQKIVDEIGEAKIKAIILTHGHFDHVTEAFELKEKIGAPVMISEKDEAMMAYSTQITADKLLKDGDIVEGFKVILTPGHSRGSICLYNEKAKLLFSGDTLFFNDHGRTDLPGSSPKDMLSSLKKLLSLDPGTKVFPGHGKPTTISNEQNLIHL